jgi:hypothetical protein
VASPSNLQKYSGFPRLYTSSIDSNDDALIMLLRHGITALVDRVMIHYAVEDLYQAKSRRVIKNLRERLSQRYGNQSLVTWLLHYRYGNGVFEAALFHAIGLPYVLHLRRIIPAQAWPVIIDQPIEGDAFMAWHLLRKARKDSDLICDEWMVKELFEKKSLNRHRDRGVRIGLTFTLILKWLLDHNQGRAAFQVARTCRAALCCYHTILMPNDMHAYSWTGETILRHYFGGGGGGEERWHFIESNETSFVIFNGIQFIQQGYRIPFMSVETVSMLDPYQYFSAKLSTRRNKIFSITAMAIICIKRTRFI